MNTLTDPPIITREVGADLPLHARGRLHDGWTGILGEDDRVELIDGQIIPQMPIGTAHAGAVKRLNQLFTSLRTVAASLSVDPIALDPFNEPETDVALPACARLYANSHPAPEDVLLIVEVADAVTFDRGRNSPTPAGIPEVWLVDLVANHQRLSPPGSRAHGSHRHRSGATILILFAEAARRASWL